MSLRKVVLFGTLFLLSAGIMIYSGCTAGITKEQRIEMFIQDMESGAGANPKEHFSGTEDVQYITAAIFESSNMDPSDSEFDITDYSISNNNFSIYFDSSSANGGSNQTATGTFTSVSTGITEDWYIRNLYIPDFSDNPIPDGLAP